MKHKHPKYRIIIAIIVIFVLLTFIIAGIFLSKRLKTSTYSLQCDNIVSPFTIVQVSDLHYPKNYISFEEIEKEIVSANPNFVALTGDIIDGSASLEDMSYICTNFDKIAQKYPTFYILGNHEIGHESLDEYIDLLRNSNIIFLNNDLKIYHINGNKIAIIGLSDGKKLNDDNVPLLPSKNACKYSVLLAHRPELFDNYCESLINLVLSGHTHGGQFRLFNQGLFAPNQGIFPKYSHGLYQKGASSMLISSGLSGNGRFYNPYEINVINISP
jgi:predicted MPP superfamily phosphohydrolase